MTSLVAGASLLYYINTERTVMLLGEGVILPDKGEGVTTWHCQKYNGYDTLIIEIVIYIIIDVFLVEQSLH